jgi:RHS repeat-associated protein
LEGTDNAALSTGDIDFTLAAWVKLESETSGTTTETILSKYDSSTVREYSLYYTGATADKFAFQLYNSGGTSVCTVQANTFGTVTTGTWYYIVVWHDATANTCNIQVNNTVADSAAETGVASDTAANFRVGALQTTETLFFDGLIDEVLFYKKALSTAERNWLYNNTLGRSVIDVNPPAAEGWLPSSYAYSTAIPHAVTSVVRGAQTDSYDYDANGNMTCRIENNVSFKQTYNAENRIATIQKLETGTCASPGVTAAHWAFAYDGDGTRTATLYTPYVSGSPGTPVLTTYYFGGLYEVTDSAVRKYYSLAGQTVAMKEGTSLKYFLSDHLGSTLAVLDSAGAVLQQQRYLPFGQVRTISGSTSVTATDFGYTSQRNLADMGLMDYRARFYSASLGRFIQPDMIVPDMASPKSWNRFSYVQNNPVAYSDPTGHKECDEVDSYGNCKTQSPVIKKNPSSGCGGPGQQKCGGNPNGSTTTIGPPPPPIITAPEMPGPFDELREGWKALAGYARYMNNAVGLVQDLGIATDLLKKGFLWGKAINPDPRLDFILGFSGQVISDLGNSNLTLGQRLARAGIVGLESMATGLVSDAAGAIGFLAGEALIPEGGGVVGYGLAAISVSIYVDEVVWNDFNQYKFSDWGLGSFP